MKGTKVNTSVHIKDSKEVAVEARISSSRDEKYVVITMGGDSLNCVRAFMPREVLRELVHQGQEALYTWWTEKE